MNELMNELDEFLFNKNSIENSIDFNGDPLIINGDIISPHDNFMFLGKTYNKNEFIFNKIILVGEKIKVEDEIIALCDSLRDGCCIIQQSKQYLIKLNKLYFQLNQINQQIKYFYNVIVD